MASLGQIPLDTFADGPAIAAVALQLSGTVRRRRILNFRQDGWEVEFNPGETHLVARTDRNLVDEGLLGEGIGVAQKALDLIALLDRDAHVAKAPESQNITYRRSGNGRGSVFYRSSTDVPIDMSFEAVVIHPDGREERSPVEPVPDWNPAFRFYRLSQSSRDMFEAYRNLFLGLEALFDHLFPKGRREGEREWLVRAVTEVSGRIDLGILDQSAVPDRPRALVDRLYGVRLKLFHAKTGRAIVPEDRTGYLEVAAAYPLLISLWSETVRAWLSPTRGGGVVTYEGFRIMIESAYSTARLAVSETLSVGDAMPQDALVGPWIIAERGIGIRESRPGQMVLSDVLEVARVPFTRVQHVALLNPAEAPLMGGPISSGLDLEGCDSLAVSIALNLKNRGSAKLEFE